MNTRVVLSIAFVALGLIIAAVPQNTTLPYKLTADQMLEESNNRTYIYTPEEVADILVQKDPEFQLIDVRNADEFEKFALPGAVNIPLTSLLSDDYRDYIDQGVKRNIFYSNGTLDATKAWMITRQLGFENNYVLEGGLNYWAEVIMNPVAPVSTSANEEFAKYDLRKAAGQALDGTTINEEAPIKVQSPKPPIKRRATKKRVEGGC